MMLKKLFERGKLINDKESFYFLPQADKRNLSDNLQLRTKHEEIEKKERKIRELEQQIGDINLDNIEAQEIELKAKQKKLEEEVREMLYLFVSFGYGSAFVSFGLHLCHGVCLNTYIYAMGYV